MKARAPIDDVAVSDLAARVWDDYLFRFGPAAYVRMRYLSACELPPIHLREDREDDESR